MTTLPHPAAPLRGFDLRAAATTFRGRGSLFLLLAILMAGPASAAGVAESYPAGSIATRSQAAAAQRAAEAEIGGINRAEAQGKVECQRKVLVNDCLAALRRDSEAGRRAARRVELEAKDLIRKLDAEEAAQRKAESARRNAERDAERARREAQPAAGKTAPAATPRITPTQAQANRAAASQRETDLKARQDEAAQRAAAAPARRAGFEARQAEAARKAREAELKRLENERKRAERAANRKKAEEERAAAAARIDAAQPR